MARVQIGVGGVGTPPGPPQVARRPAGSGSGARAAASVCERRVKDMGSAGPALLELRSVMRQLPKAALWQPSGSPRRLTAAVTASDAQRSPRCDRRARIATPKSSPIYRRRAGCPRRPSMAAPGGAVPMAPAGRGANDGCQ